MARQLKIVLADNEDIVAYECNLISRRVRVFVGIGSLDKEGNFTIQADQTFQIYDISGDDFDELMAAQGQKPAGTFRKEDLWAPVDIKRQRILDEKIDTEAASIEEAKANNA